MDSLSVHPENTTETLLVLVQAVNALIFEVNQIEARIDRRLDDLRDSVEQALELEDEN